MNWLFGGGRAYYAQIKDKKVKFITQNGFKLIGFIKEKTKK